MRVPVAARQLNQAQPVAMRVEPHGLGIDRNRRAEGHPLGKVAVMQLMTHADCARRSCGNQPLPSAGSFSSPMAGYWPDRPADATGTAGRASYAGCEERPYTLASAPSRVATLTRAAPLAEGIAMSDRASPQSSPRIEQ